MKTINKLKGRDFALNRLAILPLYSKDTLPILCPKTV